MQQQIENEQMQYENEPSILASDVFAELAKPFPANEIKWRAGATSTDKKQAIALAYIDARHVMNRLDSVLSPMDWKDSYKDVGGIMVCDLSIRVGGEWITKSDGAGETNVEGEKGSISDALKRAGVKFGIGRYLYELKNEWVEIDKRKRIVKPPALPKWATPEGWKSPFIDDFNETLLANAQSIIEIRAHLTDYLFTQENENSLAAASEIWFPLADEVKRNIWRAPSKGGIFTTQQVQVIKSTEFRQSYYGEEI